MKNVLTLKSIILPPVFILLVLLSANLIAKQSSTPPDGCECSGTVVKFNWVANDFVLEPGHDAHGITISNVVTNDEGEAKCFDWSSTNPMVISVCLKLGGTYETTDYSGGSNGGSICGQVIYAISHIEFCVDEEMPVELTSFLVNLQHNVPQLIWETATEVNNYGFEIQRASDSEDWNKVGFVEGHGNSNSPKYYSFTDPEVKRSGTYSYRLKQIDIDGQFEYSDVVNLSLSAPIEYKLNQNYPNPFNPTTTISYSIPQQSHVSIIVYNIFGEEVSRLVNETKEAGTYSKVFNANHLASGLYIYTIETENYTATKKLTLLK
jgi:Secretion system C-terminal sorting domain